METPGALSFFQSSASYGERAFIASEETKRIFELIEQIQNSDDDSIRIIRVDDPISEWIAVASYPKYQTGLRNETKKKRPNNAQATSTIGATQATASHLLGEGATETDEQQQQQDQLRTKLDHGMWRNFFDPETFDRVPINGKLKPPLPGHETIIKDPAVEEFLYRSEQQRYREERNHSAQMRTRPDLEDNASPTQSIWPRRREKKGTTSAPLLPSNHNHEYPSSTSNFLPPLAPLTKITPTQRVIAEHHEVLRKRRSHLHETIIRPEETSNLDWVSIGMPLINGKKIEITGLPHRIL